MNKNLISVTDRMNVDDEKCRVKFTFTNFSSNRNTHTPQQNIQ